MRIKTKQGLHTLRRAHAFLAGREVSAALGDLKPHVEALSASIVRLEQFATEQAARANALRVATDAKRALATALRREYLRPIAQIARRLFAHDPNLRQGFRLPLSRDDEGLIQTANAFAEGVAEHKEKFTGRGLPANAAERLLQATEAFRQAIVSRSLDYGRRSAATTGMMTEAGRGRDLVRLIDLMLAPRLANAPEQLAEWRTIARFVRSEVVVAADPAPLVIDGGSIAA